MRAVFGVVGLLVALAIVGLLAVRRLRATGQSIADLRPAAAVAAPASDTAAATVREQSQQLQQRVQSDVVKALEQGAVARKDEAGQ